MVQTDKKRIELILNERRQVVLNTVTQSSDESILMIRSRDSGPLIPRPGTIVLIHGSSSNSSRLPFSLGSHLRIRLKHRKNMVCPSSSLSSGVLVVVGMLMEAFQLPIVVTSMPNEQTHQRNLRSGLTLTIKKNWRSSLLYFI